MPAPSLSPSTDQLLSTIVDNSDVKIDRVGRMELCLSAWEDFWYLQASLAATQKDRGAECNPYPEGLVVFYDDFREYQKGNAENLTFDDFYVPKMSDPIDKLIRPYSMFHQAAACWLACNRTTFYASEAVQDNLSSYDLKDLTWKEIRPPTPTFLLMLPKPLLYKGERWDALLYCAARDGRASITAISSRFDLYKPNPKNQAGSHPLQAKTGFDRITTLKQMQAFDPGGMAVFSGISCNDTVLTVPKGTRPEDIELGQAVLQAACGFCLFLEDNRYSKHESFTGTFKPKGRTTLMSPVTYVVESGHNETVSTIDEGKAIDPHCFWHKRLLLPTIHKQFLGLFQRSLIDEVVAYENAPLPELRQEWRAAIDSFARLAFGHPDFQERNHFKRLSAAGTLLGKINFVIQLPKRELALSYAEALAFNLENKRQDQVHTLHPEVIQKAMEWVKAFIGADDTVTSKLDDFQLALRLFVKRPVKAIKKSLEGLWEVSGRSQNNELARFLTKVGAPRDAIPTLKEMIISADQLLSTDGKMVLSKLDQTRAKLHELWEKTAELDEYLAPFHAKDLALSFSLIESIKGTDSPTELWVKPLVRTHAKYVNASSSARKRKPLRRSSQRHLWINLYSKYALIPAGWETGLKAWT